MAPPVVPRLPPFLRDLLLGACFFLALVLILGPAPKRLFHDVTIKGEGMRLLRDDYEMQIFYRRSEWVESGAVPYSKAQFEEYPPLGMLFLAAPRLLGGDQLAYTATLQGALAVLFGLLVAVTGSLLRRLGRPRRLLALFLLPAFLYFSLWRFDLFPALLVAAALLAVTRERYGLALLALWASVMAKIYPVLFIVPFTLYLLPRLSSKAVRRRLLIAALVAAGLTAAVIVVAYLKDVRPITSVLKLHLSRPFEAGSLRELFDRWLWALPLTAQESRLLIAIPCFILQFVAVPLLIVRASVRDIPALVRACVFVLVPFMAFGSFFSQQWIIWLAPLVVLVGRRAELALLAALDLLLFLQFPVLYDIDPHSWHYDIVTVARTVLLAALWALNARALKAPRRPAVAGP